MDRLSLLRKQIDEIDFQILDLLSKRFKIVKEIWKYKLEHWIQPLQPQRWQQVLEKVKSKAAELWLDENFVEDIWNRFHKYSLEIEENKSKL